MQICASLCTKQLPHVTPDATLHRLPSQAAALRQAAPGDSLGCKARADVDPAQHLQPHA